MNISDINSAIMRGAFNNEELASIVDAVKYARAQLGRRVMYQIMNGDTVRFTGKRGNIMTGKVINIKLKNVVVEVSGTRWNVPANMLTKV